MSQTKIDWCDEVFNVVIGCKNSCSYCYARKINNRFEFIKDFSKPEWRENTYNKKFPKKPKRIFVNSMSDIAFWKDSWMIKVLAKINNYPQHTFLFLTKKPNIYFKYEKYIPDNCMIGFTATDQKSFDFGNNCFADLRLKKFVSIEPIQGQIEIKHFYGHWIIIGAETGNRKGKIIPQYKWIDIINQEPVPIFMKDNLKPYYKGIFKQQYPEVS
jgi:protein gp37